MTASSIVGTLEGAVARPAAWPHPDAALDSRTTRLVWLILIGALLARLVGITAPYHDQYVWRSIDNAAIARNFVAQGMDIRYPRVDWAGPEGLVETELPLQMYAVALVYEGVGREVPWVGRLSTVLVGIGMLAAFGRLALALIGRRAAMPALFVLAFVPTSIFFSRTFQQDALMLLAQLVALYHAGRWLLGDARRHDPVVLALALALGALVKPTALLIGVPIAAMAFMRYGLAALWQPALYAVVIGALLPPVAWYLHARGLYLEHGYTFGIFSGGHDKFQWGRFLTQPYWYWEMAARMATWHLTPAGLVLAAGGGLVLWRRIAATRRPEGGAASTKLEGSAPGRASIRTPLPAWPVLLTWLLTMLAFIPLVAEGNLDMSYYQWVAIPPLALLAGLAVDAVWEQRAGRVAAGILLALLPLMSIYILRDSYGVIQTKHLALAGAIRETVPAGALILDAGAYDVHNPGGYNYEPLQFYYSGHKGWGLLEEEFRIEDVERYRQQGATWLVSKSTHLLERHPEFVSALRSHYTVVREEPGILIVALRRSS